MILAPVERKHLIEGSPMPIGWGVNHTSRLVSATGTGVLTKADFDSYLDELAAAATLSYGKIFHMDGCRLELSRDDLVSVGARIRSHEVDQVMGRVAVVAASDELHQQAEKFSSKILAERPLRIFRDVESALAWLTDARFDQVQSAKSSS
jgi:hypothetical protein